MHIPYTELETMLRSVDEMPPLLATETENRVIRARIFAANAAAGTYIFTHNNYERVTHLLDIGVSDGLGLKSLFVSANLIVGCDIDDEKLAKCSSRPELVDFQDRLLLQNINAENLTDTFGENNFPAVNCVGMFEGPGWPEDTAQGIIGQIYHVLQPGGIGVMTAINLDTNHGRQQDWGPAPGGFHFNLQNTLEALTQAGFPQEGIQVYGQINERIVPRRITAFSSKKGRRMRMTLPRMESPILPLIRDDGTIEPEWDIRLEDAFPIPYRESRVVISGKEYPTPIPRYFQFTMVKPVI